MLIKFLEVTTVLFWASLKYMFGLAFATGFDLGFIPSVLLTVAGGMAGVLFFGFLGKQIIVLWNKYIRKKKPVRVRFGKFPRLMVNFKQKFGLAGIAFLTPILLQVPIGTLIAVRMKHSIPKISLYMLISFTLYSVVFCGAYYALNINMKEIMTTLIAR
jgi:hypothetical protein